MEKHIGYRIRQIRRLREYSQEYMAGQMSITKKKLCRIENSSATVDFELLEEIAAFLKIDTFCLKEFEADDFLIIYSKLCHLRSYLKLESIEEPLQNIDMKSSPQYK